MTYLFSGLAITLLFVAGHWILGGLCAYVWCAWLADAVVTRS
jgi:hypothetical protein